MMLYPVTRDICRSLQVEKLSFINSDAERRFIGRMLDKYSDACTDAYRRSSPDQWPPPRDASISSIR